MFKNFLDTSTLTTMGRDGCMSSNMEEAISKAELGHFGLSLK